ncbi:MAG: type II toxin-antitoxin system VapC family toxin [Candidatus Hydrogenedentes bacterium]|nr:type II toxin-antitoxin system VapC family toxin [Candidatus Hydrogenedentota bacterium]
MILLDTHVWIWWVQGDSRIPAAFVEFLDRRPAHTTGVSVFSCWEVGMLSANGRIKLPCDPVKWTLGSLAYPGVILVPMSPEIAVGASHLPGRFHSDPADRLLVETARVLNCPMDTSDRQILAYSFVDALRPDIDFIPLLR